ncbi:alpha/beta hydrolase [Aurantimonas sp. A2-1-M11]|uniref:alpha/beta fold hydrolase n=1 Tax=Aurantimonas sp. A2-1-M11 TaxID=3113712 RepID=UPI002F958124
MARNALLIGGGLLAATAAAVVLRTWQAERQNPPLGKFVEVDGVRLHYVERGSGDPLVLLHGNSSLIQDFLTSDLVRLAAQTKRVIIFDRPGYGYSDRPRRSKWTPRAQADLFDAALKRIGVDRANVLGHSWGTLVAVQWALRHPESISGLTLVAGYYFPTARVDAMLAGGAAVPLIGDLMRYTVSPVWGRLTWPLFLRALFGPSKTSQHFAGVPRSFILSPLSIRAAAEEGAIMVPSVSEVRNRYAELKLPVTIIAGDADRIVSMKDQSERLHRTIPGSRLVVVPDVGHMVHHIEPRTVIGAITSNA